MRDRTLPGLLGALLLDAEEVPGDVRDLQIAARGHGDDAETAADGYAEAYARFVTESAPHLRQLERIARGMPGGAADLSMVDEVRSADACAAN